MGQLFAGHGATVIDADATYHALLQPQAGRPSPLAQAVADAFAPLPLLGADGRLDRRRLAAHVFADAAARLQLEALTHPAVAAARLADLAGLQAAGVQHVIYDVPLLYEKNLGDSFAGVVVVWVPPDLQLQRLAQRDGLVGTAAQQRLAAQLPLDEKRRRATWVIDNSGSRAQAAAAVATVWAAMQRR